MDFVIRLKDLASSAMDRFSRKVDDSASHFDKLSNKSTSTFKKIGNDVESTGKKVAGFGNYIKAAVISAGLFALGQSVVDTTVKYQKLEAVLATQMGSAEAGANALNMIQQVASSTPFAVDELTASFVKLKSQGFEPTKDQIIQLGDIAASMGKPFDQLAEAVLDAQSAEFERLKEFGIKASQSGNKVAFTFKGITTTVDKSSEAIRKYILGIGEMNGVQGSMAAISATTGGALSNLGDQVDFLKKGLGEAFKPIIDQAIAVLGTFVGWLTKVGNWMKEHPRFVKGLAIAIGIATGAIALLTIGMKLFTVEVWANTLAMLANPVTWIILAIVALSAAIAYVIVMFDGWGKSMTALWEIIKTFGRLTSLTFKSMWEGITYHMEIAWLKIKDFFQWIEAKIVNVGKALNQVKNFDFSGATDTINQKITTSASAQIAARQAEHEGKMQGYAKDIADAYKTIGSEWDKVGLTKAQDDPVAKMKSKLGLGGTSAFGAGTKPTDAAKDKAKTIHDGGSRPTTINMTFHKMQDQIVVHTTNLQMGAKQVAEEIIQEIVIAIEGAQAALKPE